MLDKIADRLAAQGVGTLGQTIFINQVPAECTRAVLLRPPFGGMPIDYELPNYRKGYIMLVTRGKTYDAAKQLMDDAIAALTLADTDIPGLHVNYMRARTEPYAYAGSPAGLVEFLVYIDLSCVLV